MNQRELGKEKEKLACAFLEQKGYQILTVNFVCRAAELDIVAKDGSCLVFTEVKYRKDGRCGGSRYAVSDVKKRRMIQGARYYVYQKKISMDTRMRFDVIAIEGNKIRHYINAFDAMGLSPMGS